MRVAGFLLLLALCACGAQDRVLFVTTASIGLNLDSKPATTSIGYDRTEGFIGPRYENGALPPVYALIETGGTILQPKIRQVYATGPAAIKAVSDPAEAPRPMDLTGAKKMVFFGTTTTLGAKATFAVAETGVPAPYPDSFVFGYKRREFSLIPLGGRGDDPREFYPSVIGAIDTATVVPSQIGTGLTSRQFFATGEAAEVLAATNLDVRRAFGAIAGEAIAAGKETRAIANVQLDKILQFVAPGGAINPPVLARLIEDANAAVPPAVPGDLPGALRAADAAGVRRLLANNEAALRGLYAALPTNAQ